MGGGCRLLLSTCFSVSSFPLLRPCVLEFKALQIHCPSFVPGSRGYYLDGLAASYADFQPMLPLLAKLEPHFGEQLIFSVPESLRLVHSVPARSWASVTADLGSSLPWPPRQSYSPACCSASEILLLLPPLLFSLSCLSLNKIPQSFQCSIGRTQGKE